MHHATALHFLLLVRPYMCRMLLRAAVRDALRSFDSADLDEEDPDEGVGVDERAALLQPDDFFLDDEEWYASARWLMERPQTEDFITDALMAHMTPLYVPYADVRARVPKDIVPLDVQVRVWDQCPTLPLVPASFVVLSLTRLLFCQTSMPCGHLSQHTRRPLA